MTDTIPTDTPTAAETDQPATTEVPTTEEPTTAVPSTEALAQRLADLELTVENNRLTRDAWTLIIFAIAALALLASVIAVGFGLRAIDESERDSEARSTREGAVLLAPALGTPSTSDVLGSR